MTTPTQDRDITATLSAPKQPTAEALEAAAVRLLRRAVVKSGNLRRGDGREASRHRRLDWSFLVYRKALDAAVDMLRRNPDLWPAEPDETAPDHWATIRAALAPGATDDARAAALVAVDALSTQEDR